MDTGSSLKPQRWHKRLELLSTVAMIAASSAIVWAVLTTRPPQDSRRPAPSKNTRVKPLPPNPIALSDGVVRGSVAARVGVIEFSDYECPYCAKFHQATFPQIVDQYVESGRIRFAFRHLPLEARHPAAMKAAEAAECSRRQDRFWLMHDELFKPPIDLGSESLFQKARTVGLGEVTFRQCMSGEGIVQVRQEIAQARSLLIMATPTFLFGTIEPNGHLKVTRHESGAIPVTVFVRILDELLGSTAPPGQ